MFYGDYVVVAAGMEPRDGVNVPSDLLESLEIKEQTVYIQGCGDTSIMLASRLLQGERNNRVIMSSRHFFNLDKYNFGIPYDQGEMHKFCMISTDRFRKWTGMRYES